MRLEYDPDANVAYIRLRTLPVATTEEITPVVLVDLGEDGLPVGFEILDAASALGGRPHGVEFMVLSKELMASPEHIARPETSPGQ